MALAETLTQVVTQLSQAWDEPVEVCESCHEAEFKTWEASPHGHALASLEKKGEAANS